jgi:phosphate transport system permease protein
VDGLQGIGLTGRRARPGERLVRGALLACALVSIATTAGIVVVLAGETVEFLRRVPLADYLTGTRWAPTFRPASFGVLPLLSATFLIAGIAAAVAFPLGLGTAIYLSEYARPGVRRALKPTLELLAGIPTVVFGYFALTFVTPQIAQRLVPGTRVFNALSAGLVVGISIFPVVASIAEDAMRAVPTALREAAVALGAVRRTVATRVVVPAAFSGIAAALILAFSRAVGETMIVTIASGTMPNLTADVRQGMGTVTAQIVQISLGDTPQGSLAYRTIFALGATLFVLTLALNLAAIRLVRRFRERYE